MIGLGRVTVVALFSLFNTAVGATVSTPQALNPKLTNTIDDNGGPTFYYNGSGPVPPYNTTSPPPAPLPALNSSQIEDSFFRDIVAVVNGSQYPSNCSKCITTTEIMHLAALTQSATTITNLLIRTCNAFKFKIYAATCEQEFSGVGGLGPYWAQLFQKMSLSTGDMQAWCFYHWDSCDRPAVIQIDESQWFSPKPASAMVAPPPSGQTINVLHMSDTHIDPRYAIGSEANCSQSLCCRSYSTNTQLHTSGQNASVPASRFGALHCDAPPDLAISAFAAMPQLINKSDVSFTIFTGDIVSHDRDDQLSQAYVEYEENITYALFKAEMGNSPVYPTLGNHDSYPQAYNTPNSLNGGNGSANAFSWNYNLVSSLWRQDGWINSTEAAYASTHYGAYAHTTAQGLRIISLNTDFWYRANVFNYFNFTNPDQSGILSFVISELQACEKAGQRAWIIGHVLSGYDGTNALPNPSALFYSIVRRFSPATIAGVFFGHTHEDQIQIFYDYAASSLASSNSSTARQNSTSMLRNTTAVDYNKPLAMGFIGPSVVPLNGNNAGWQLYQVDAKTFEVMGIQTYFANISEANSWTSPVWQFEYDARTAYDDGSWPTTAPLNATFWNGVAQRMLTNRTLVEQYNLLETKSSAITKNCTSTACGQQKVCYIRSGSSALGNLCPQKQGPN